MATHTVKQSGGDFSTLASALSDSGTVSGDTISIEGTWSVDDTAACTISDTNLVITTDSDSKHPGFLVEETRTAATTYYRHVYGGASDSVDVNASGCTIAGIAFISTSTTSSQEVIDYQGADVDIDACIIYSTTATTQKDGIYTSNTGRTLNVTNTVVVGFGRSGVHVQNFSGGSGTHTANIDSCTIYRCNLTDNAGGGVRVQAVLATVNINASNTVVLDCSSGGPSSSDYSTFAGTPTWTINHCIDSDNSIAAVIDFGGNNLASRTATDSDTPGAGDWVVFEDSTTTPYDLRLKTNAENDAEDSGSTTLTEDIVGTTRPQGSPAIDDRGAFEIVVAAAGFIGAALAAVIVFNSAQPTLTVGENSSAQASAILYNGQQPATQVGVVDQAASGAVLFNGQQPATQAGVIDQATSGAVLYNGQQPATQAGVIDQATSGSVLYNGQQPATQVGVIDQAAPGSVLYNGQQPAIVAGGAFVGQATSGSVLYNGQLPATQVGVIDQAAPGSVLYNGQQPATQVGVIDQAAPGSVLYNGQQPATQAGVIDQATSGSVLYNGQQPATQAGVIDQATSGSVLYNGQLPATQVGVIDQAAPGSVLYNGQQPFLVSGGAFVGQAAPGSVLYNGQQPAVAVGVIDQATSGSVLYNGQLPATQVGVIDQAAPGSVLYNGQQPFLVSGGATFIGEAVNGSILYNGQQPAAVTGVQSAVKSSEIVYTGNKPTIFRRVTVIQGKLVVTLVGDGLTVSLQDENLSVTLAGLQEENLVITLVEVV